ncbi:MAG: hypothetical protein KF864_02235 [Phycisphaeraceae bacterium]|nr:hypothetical protein [Phycisphaeraceae bacterium]MBX3409784.1 hypothetical protein [Phycisphaeraceae bacterium]
MPGLITDSLVSEYDAMFARVGDNATDEQIVAALVQDCAWTEQGAHEVLQLARKYGTSILTNALALAFAMQIEDGDAGL